MLHTEVETGDHVLFVGEVVAAHLDEDAVQWLMNFGDLGLCTGPARDGL